MLFFYLESKKIVAQGLSPDVVDESRLHRSLGGAKADGRGKIFVVDGRKTPASLSGDVRKIPKKAILNNNPYRTPREMSAGGGVITKQGKKGLKILLIYRKGKWDIAKGKLDPGETIRECAKREVQEELGIKKVKVLDFLDTTTHGYVDGKYFTVKTTHWYHMKTSETEFVPQKSEKITRVKWYSIAKAKTILGHESLVRLLNRVEHKLLYSHNSV